MVPVHGIRARLDRYSYGELHLRKLAGCTGVRRISGGHRLCFRPSRCRICTANVIAAYDARQSPMPASAGWQKFRLFGQLRPQQTVQGGLEIPG